MLFEPGMMKFDPDLVDNSNGALETLVRGSIRYVQPSLAADSVCRFG